VRVQSEVVMLSDQLRIVDGDDLFEKMFWPFTDAKGEAGRRICHKSALDEVLTMRKGTKEQEMDLLA
jgi:hypothetical protein